MMYDSFYWWHIRHCFYIHPTLKDYCMFAQKMTIYAKKNNKNKKKMLQTISTKMFFFLIFWKNRYKLLDHIINQTTTTVSLCVFFFCFCQITFYSFKQHRYHLNTINKAEPCICTSMTKTHHYHHSLWIVEKIK